MTPNFTEQILINRSQQGDLDAFNQLVLNYQDNLFHFLISFTGDPDTAEDITQESFIKAYQHIGSFQGGTFKSWLFRIGINAARDLARQRKRHTLLALYPNDENGEENDSPAWLTDHSASVEAAIQQRETSLQLGKILDELPSNHRSILTLIDVLGMDYVEAAQILNLPLGTVKSRLARARMQMRNKLLVTGLTSSYGAAQALHGFA